MRKVEICLSMDAIDKAFSELVSIIKSWIPWQSEPANVSRDFWMPDHSCRVCYECDAQFSLFNRRHHCRLCGRIFCSKCTTNSVPAPFSGSQRNSWDEWEKIRVCNYCYKQWEQGIVSFEKSGQASNLERTMSATSVASSKTSATGNSSNITICSMPYSVGSYKQKQQSSCVNNMHQSPKRGKETDREGLSSIGGRNIDLVEDLGDPLTKQYGFSMSRSDDDEDEYDVYRSDSDIRQYPQVNSYYGQAVLDGINNIDGSQNVPNGENIDAKLSSNYNFDDSGLEGPPVIAKNGDEPDICDENDAPSSLYVSEDVDAEPVDFENNGLLWLPPEPEDEEDDREAIMYDDDDDNDGNGTGEWGYLRSSSSFGSGEYRQRDRSNEEHKKVMKNVVDGHFRALVSQLLQVENLPVEDNNKNSWLEIIISLSWEAANLLKPDMSKGGGMDPAGYSKVKCIARGSRIESVVVKGVVCKKNVAHRRMTSKVDKPRLLILGGALEYQRVTNLLSSVDTLLQQETDHLKMAVAKIASHQPSILLVEKSVSRYAQEYLLAKDITLVLNVKRPLLERLARCTGTQIVPSIDHLSSQKLGYCETFHVEKFLEDLIVAVPGAKKPMKTLMFFEGCPKPLGCTILLRGADMDELKKVKHVVQYAVFAAYHLAMETSFLADEGVSLPELPLNSLALPNKSSSIQRSISTVPGFSVPGNEKSQIHDPNNGPRRTKSVTVTELVSPVCNTGSLSNGYSQSLPSGSNLNHSAALYSSIVVSGDDIPELHPKKLLSKQPLVKETSVMDNTLVVMDDTFVNGTETSEQIYQGILAENSRNGYNQIYANKLSALGSSLSPNYAQNHTEKKLVTTNEEPVPQKEEFPPSPSDHQSILVSLSSRCVWKGTVCERSHLFRIKYYGSFDKPLGRFLRDHLFDQSYRCDSCDMPSEAHVHCYTHRQGTLTISVKKLPEVILPGERDGKIWMWHRCLRCPRISGFPPATQRIVMSDAAWGLSFGKFLELSFSNHAAASRVASCGHSLHRDCLRFYGFGKMVACFRYASIDVHSVYLPPHKLNFDHGKQDWIQKESDEMVNRAELLFSEVLNCLSQIGEKKSNSVQIISGHKTPELRSQVAELEGMLRRERLEFEETLKKILNQEKRNGQPGIDILEINRLWRQLLFQSYVWDHRLVYADSLANSNNETGLSSSTSEDKEIPIEENLMTGVSLAGRGFSSADSIHGLVDAKSSQSDAFHQEIDVAKNKQNEKEQPNLSLSKSVNDQSDHLELELGVRRALSEGPFSVVPSLSDTLDAKWTGENQSGIGIQKDSTSGNPDISIADALTTTTQRETYYLGDRTEDQNGSKSIFSSLKSYDNLEDSLSWLGMPFVNFYRQFNKSLFASSQKIEKLVDYNPVFVSSFGKLGLQGGARMLMPIGVNDTVIPIYDDEPSSIIAHALMSSQYHSQLSDELERPKDGSELASSYFSDSGAFQSFSSADDTAFDSQKSFRSVEDMILSMSGSRNSSMFDPVMYTETLQPGFNDQLWAHFNRLPTRYALDVNVERAEDVLMHKRLLQLAYDPANRPSIEVHLVQLHPSSDENPADSLQSYSPEVDSGQSSPKYSSRQGILPPPAFGSSPNLEELALEENDSEDSEEERFEHASVQYSRPMHEITISTDDKPKLLSQLTALLAEVGLNIQEAHASSTTDGYSLDVFVVEGWPYEEIEKLKATLEKEVLKIERHDRSRQQSISSSDECDQARMNNELDHLNIPSDGTDVWEIDPKHLKYGTQIASASYGELFKGTYCSQEVAIKVLKTEHVSTEMQKEFAQEVYIMRKVRHKNVVQFMGACTKPPGLCIVTEFMSGGSVYDYLHKHKGCFKFPTLLKVAIDVSKGMSYLHQHNIIHRDLKSANLLMDENGVVKVADFGVARVKVQSGVMTAETGTYRWMAPEVIEHKPYDHKADVFSFGIVLWELLTGKLPYEYLTPLQAAIGVVQKSIRPTIPKSAHPKFVQILERSWQQDPTLRPDFSEIIELLQQLATEVGDEGEERRRGNSGGFLSVLRRGHH